MTKFGFSISGIGIKHVELVSISYYLTAMKAKNNLFVIDPIDSLNPHTDTSIALMRECHRRGNTNLICKIGDLSIIHGRGYAITREITFTEDQFLVSGAMKTLFDDCNVIFMRKDPPVDMRFLAATMILDCHDAKKTVVINNPTSLRTVNEKIWCQQFPNLVPKTFTGSSKNFIKEAVAELGKAVLKPLFGAGGSGILLLEKDDKNLSSAIDLLTNNESVPIVVQEYVPQVIDGDKRLILLGGKPIGALLRVPSNMDFRANLHVGGIAKKASITKQDQEIAQLLAPKLVALGLYFVGIDIIGDKLTEVNVTSPTGLQEIDRFEGLSGNTSLSALVMDYVEQITPS